jgi:dTDP-4-amino-4,6-dideoxygalactose transaminase
MTYRIPFNKPCLSGKELLYVAEAILRGHTAGDGSFTQKCHQFLETALHVKRVLLTTSCTHALELAALLLNVAAGDEVILPSFTFVSTVNAFVLRGAIPVFADIRPDTLNIDESQLERLITSRTKAVVPVHYAGIACEMDVIGSIAARNGIRIVEDNAHGLFGSYNGRFLGTFGCMAAQSFHETKNITCGEGGALLINDDAFVERAEILREKGTNRSRFYRGQIDRYTWVDIGSSYLPSEILAAYLCAQLESHTTIQAKRRRIWERYHQALVPWAREHGVRTPIVPEGCEQPYHMFYLLLPSLAARTKLIMHLRSQGILSVFHYMPLHLSEMGRKYGGFEGQCPVTESVSDRLLRLPFYNDLSESEQNEIIEAIFAFRFERDATAGV